MSILALCHPLVDTTWQTTQDTLDKYDLKVNHRQLRDMDNKNHHMLFRELKELVDRKDPSIGITAGGSTMNSIRAVQVWSLEKNAESNIKFHTMGGVGDDAYANSLEELDEKLGIESHLCRGQQNLPTGSCAVVVVGGQRTMTTDLFAAWAFTATQKEVMAVLDPPQNHKTSLVGSAVHITNPVEPLKYLMSGAYYANANGFKDVLECSKDSPLPFILVFSLSECFCCNHQNTLDAVPKSEIIFGRLEEGVALCIAMGELPKDANAETFDELEKQSVAKKIAAIKSPPGGPPQRWVVLTSGADPVIVAVDKFDGNGCSAATFDVPPISPHEIVDDCGAGDCFMGGFIAGLISKQEKALHEHGRRLEIAGHHHHENLSHPCPEMIPAAVEAGLDMAARNLRNVGNACLQPMIFSSADWDKGESKLCCNIA